MSEFQEYCELSKKIEELEMQRKEILKRKVSRCNEIINYIKENCSLIEKEENIFFHENNFKTCEKREKDGEIYVSIPHFSPLSSTEELFFYSAFPIKLKLIFDDNWKEEISKNVLDFQENIAKHYEQREKNTWAAWESIL